MKLIKLFLLSPMLFVSSAYSISMYSIKKNENHNVFFIQSNKKRGLIPVNKEQNRLNLDNEHLHDIEDLNIPEIVECLDPRRRRNRYK